MSERVGGVVLAAGASRRAGRIKALATVDGVAFVVAAAQTLIDGGCDEVRVVLGAPHASSIAAVVGDLAVCVDNPAPERGMLSSLQIGLCDSWAAAVVSLVDHPSVRPQTVTELIRAWRRSAADVVRPVFAGKRGHPYVISRSVFAALREGDLERGARPVLARQSSFDVDVSDPHVRQDLDTPERIDTVADPSSAPESCVSQRGRRDR